MKSSPWSRRMSFFLGLLASCSAPLVAEAVQLRGRAVSRASATEWRTCLEAEAADSQFWMSEWAALEEQLLSLRSLTGAAPPPSNGTAGASPHPSNHTESTHKLEHEKSPLAGLKLNLNPKSPADLVPALAMLKGLYEDGKERISKLNAREKDSKRKFDEKQAVHDQRIATIEARFKNGTLSAEFRTNETKDENRLWNYWSRVRERQHRQFHTSLKIQHSTMSKVKSMINMYEKAIAGTADKSQVAQQLSKVASGVAPEIVLVQRSSKELAIYCDEALAAVRRERLALLTVVKQPWESKA